MLPRILGRKVLAGLDLGLPDVPDGHVREGRLAVDSHSRVAVVLEHDRGVDGDGGVDAVRLVDDLQLVGGLGENGVVQGLVLVDGVLQA